MMVAMASSYAVVAVALYTQSNCTNTFSEVRLDKSLSQDRIGSVHYSEHCIITNA